MADKQVDLLRRDECQPLTQAQIADIKAQTVTRPKANVNIVPYEVYDEDGVEKTVGEYRKTIDGVKKKKQIYGKIIKFTIPSNQNAYDLSTLSVDKLISCDGTFQAGAYTLRLGQWYNSSYYTTFCQNTDGGANLLWMNVAGYQGSSATAYITYTKTTDSWENV